MDELSKRNTLTVIQEIKAQNHKILEQQKQIDGLLNTISTLQQTINQLEHRILLWQSKQVGTGPTVK